MNKDVLRDIESLSNVKGIEKQDIFEALEIALAKATQKLNPLLDVEVVMDRETGDYETFRCWMVVEDEDFSDEFIESQISLSDAIKKDPSLNVSDVIKEQIESVPFGRIATQKAKQIIVEKIREAERKELVNSYLPRLGSLLTGAVKRTTREHVLLDMGDNVEALLSRTEMLPNEALRMNDRVRVYLYDVHYEPRGPQLFVSRTHPEMLIRLFELEVPEVGEQVIRVMGAARDPGSRAKIAVKTNDGRIDPVGACVGMRGSRVQAVSGELGGERIDIILWDDNPAQLVINAMAPAEVESIVLDEDTQTMDIAVDKEQLSQAIGRSGQNVRLASELTGWTLNIMSSEEAQEKTETESGEALSIFVEQLEVDEDVAAVLVDAGFSTVEEVAYISVDEMLKIEEFDEDIVEALRERANNVLLTKALTGIDEAKPEEDLLTMDGMTEALAFVLARNEVMTMEDLAELSVDDLQEIQPMEESDAAQLIMKAREPWFK